MALYLPSILGTESSGSFMLKENDLSAAGSFI